MNRSDIGTPTSTPYAVWESRWALCCCCLRRGEALLARRYRQHQYASPFPTSSLQFSLFVPKFIIFSSLFMIKDLLFVLNNFHFCLLDSVDKFDSLPRGNRSNFDCFARKTKFASFLFWRIYPSVIACWFASAVFLALMAALTSALSSFTSFSFQWLDFSWAF